MSRSCRQLLLVLLLGAAVTLAACGGDDGKKNGAATEKASCQTAAQPPPKRVKKRRPPNFGLSPAKRYTAVVQTNCGDFTIALAAKKAPRTGGSFVTLAREGFYDGLTFHRIVRDFVVQGGDPNGDGTGGPGYSVRERPPRDTVYSEGVVAMAKTGTEPSGTSGSQFFVVTSDNAALDPVYALLGRVTKGIDVVHRIEAQPVDQTDRPLQPVVIDRIKIETTRGRR